MKKSPFLLLIIILVSGCTSTLTGSAVQENIEISTPDIVCKDSDGGDVIDIQGTVIIEVKGNTWKNYTDTCVNAESIMEYFCQDGAYISKKYNCDNACINGMCR
ncbi:MAG: hypothetical protein QF824_00930 [Candidatus Woesearchaeota archaeon]|jgi:hypothetical protein|nr:hypothetical protein [Candidatus Woesearchaeota archaeon]|tara:strand:- start:78 stop:389 length:312 start_codon:yes stop_codon:yes gene_type:complete